LTKLRKISESVLNGRVHVRRVARLLKVRARRLSARVLRHGKTPESERFFEARKISEKRISSANALRAQTELKSALRREITNAELVNSADLKAAALVRHDQAQETSASVHLVVIDRQGVNLHLTLAVTARRARRSVIAKRVSVRASRRSVSNAKARSKGALPAEIVRHVKVASAVQTRVGVKVAQETEAHAAAADLAVAAHVLVDRDQVVRDRVDRNQVRAAAEEARGLHFVAISFSDTLIRGTYLFLCRRSPNLYRSA
jgi:hypothetical protein